MKTMKLRIVLLALICAGRLTQAADTWHDASPHRSGIVKANGIRLHYLDWGGSGEAMVFLAGMGNTAHVFDTLAPRFTKPNGKTPAFHAIGMTRRGFGQSDRPDTGYDVPTRVADLAAFLDAMKIKKAVLVGHSLAGDELTAFASANPERVIKLVYLDAAYDRSHIPEELVKTDDAVTAAITSQYPQPPADATPVERGRIADKARFGNLWNEALEAEVRERFGPPANGTLRERPGLPFDALIAGTAKANLDYVKLASPTLSFFAARDMLAEIPAEKRGEFQEVGRIWSEYQQSNIAVLKKNPHAQVIVFTMANHYCWFDHGDEVVAAMRTFLAGKR
jgi:pimeloyl-ACP methyl ester carboxylesterase